MQITVDQVLTWDARANPKSDKPKSREDLISLFGGEEISLEDLVNTKIYLGAILDWLLQPELIPEKTLRELACKWAEPVLAFFEIEFLRRDHFRRVLEAAKSMLSKDWLKDAWTDARTFAALAFEDPTIFAKGRYWEGGEETAYWAALACLHASEENVADAARSVAYCVLHMFYDVMPSEKQFKILHELREKGVNVVGSYEESLKDICEVLGVPNRTVQ